MREAKGEGVGLLLPATVGVGREERVAAALPVASALSLTLPRTEPLWEGLPLGVSVGVAVGEGRGVGVSRFEAAALALADGVAVPSRRVRVGAAPVAEAEMLAERVGEAVAAAVRVEVGVPLAVAVEGREAEEVGVTDAVLSPVVEDCTVAATVDEGEGVSVAAAGDAVRRADPEGLPRVPVGNEDAEARADSVRVSEPLDGKEVELGQGRAERLTDTLAVTVADCLPLPLPVEEEHRVGSTVLLTLAVRAALLPGLRDALGVLEEETEALLDTEAVEETVLSSELLGLVLVVGLTEGLADSEGVEGGEADCTLDTEADPEAIGVALPVEVGLPCTVGEAEAEP